MAIERDAVAGMLHALERTLGTLDAASASATQLIAAHRSGKPLAASVLQHYEQQFEALTKQREHMRTLIAKWWTLMEERH